MEEDNPGNWGGKSEAKSKVTNPPEKQGSSSSCLAAGPLPPIIIEDVVRRMMSPIQEDVSKIMHMLSKGGSYHIAGSSSNCPQPDDADDGEDAADDGEGEDDDAAHDDEERTTSNEQNLK